MAGLYLYINFKWSSNIYVIEYDFEGFEEFEEYLDEILDRSSGVTEI